MEKMKQRSAGGWGVYVNPAASHRSGSRERRAANAQHGAMLRQRGRHMSQSKESRMDPVRAEELPHIGGQRAPITGGNAAVVFPCCTFAK